MRRIFFKTAFSLLELIIASVLVVIVIMGIFAVNGVLSSNSQDYGQRYFVKSETQTTLNHILNNASMAIGSGINVPAGVGTTVSDQGIVFGGDLVEGWNDQFSFCIHQDIPITQPLDGATVNSTPSTPPSYTNSRWLCYTWFGPANPSTACSSILNCSSYQIWYCAMAYNSNTLSTRGAGSCTSNNSPLYLGTAFTNPFSTIAPTYSKIPATFTSTSGLSITIQNCLNNSALKNAVLSCNGTNTNPGTSSDPVNNPEVQLSGNVFPSQEGMAQN